MELWSAWMRCAMKLRPACGRLRNFFWLLVCLMAMTIRMDLAGVSSFVRVLGLQECCYGCILDFLHSNALNLERLTELWVNLVMRIFPKPLRVNGRLVLLGDGIKAPKEGRKMPAVKSLHQESQNNSKAEYIMGHSCQAIALLVGAAESFFAVPLVSRIHEGLVFTNLDKRTLLDKMVSLVDSLKITELFYFVADAYYANRKMIRGMLGKNQHLLTRLRSNAVSHYPAKVNTGPRRRGRPKIYGEKIKTKTLFDDLNQFTTAPSPVYGEKDVSIQFRAINLYWRCASVLALFVLVIHPIRGRIILLCTDFALPPLEIIRLYGLRYKIELSFKNALRVLGVYAYHFWMRSMTRIARRSGNQYLPNKPKTYRDAVVRKISAYHRHMQIGLIAQGLLQYLSSAFPQLVWKSFGSWLRTIRPGIPPSEQVTAIALRNTLPEFLVGSNENAIFKKFLLDRVDFTRSEGIRLTAYG